MNLRHFTSRRKAAGGGLGLITLALAILFPISAYSDTLTLRPSDDYMATGTWARTPASGGYYDHVSKTVVEYSSYIQHGTTAGYRMFKYVPPSLANRVNISVDVFATRQDETSGTNKLACALRIIGTNYNGTYTESPTSWEEFSNSWATNPRTGAAWTDAELCGGANSINSFGIRSNDANPPIQIAQVYMVYTFDIATATPTATPTPTITPTDTPTATPTVTVTPHALFGDIYTTAQIWNDIDTNSTVFGGQHLAAIYPMNSTGAAPTITVDWNKGNNHVVYLQHTGTATITLTNGLPGAVYHLIFEQDGAGNRVVDFTIAGVKWIDAIEPVQTLTAGKKDVLMFLYDGVDYLGTSAENF